MSVEDNKKCALLCGTMFEGKEHHKDCSFSMLKNDIIGTIKDSEGNELHVHVSNSWKESHPEGVPGSIYLPMIFADTPENRGFFEEHGIPIHQSFATKLEAFYDSKIDPDNYQNIDGVDLWEMWKNFVGYKNTGIQIEEYREFIHELDKLHWKRYKS